MEANTNIELTENIEDTRERKLIDNKFNNIHTKLKKIIENGSLFISMNQDDDWSSTIFNLVCKDHGKYSLTGLDIKMDKHCNECEKISLTAKIDSIIDLDINSRVSKLNEYVPLDYTDVIIKDIDSTIRPYCDTHGQFITTPRKLLEGDSCKWCDGIQTKDGIQDYRLNRDGRISEKIRIIYGNEYTYVPGTFKKYSNILLVKDKDNKNRSLIPGTLKSPEYSNFINEVKDPDKHNAIFFKLFVMDSSTKFKFTITHVIYLSEIYLKKYQDYLENNKGDGLLAQDLFTQSIIDDWFRLVFYNGDTKAKHFEYTLDFFKWSNQQRIYSLALQYINDNKSKQIQLTDELSSRIYHNINSFSIPVFWHEHIQESTSRSIVYFRETQLKTEKTCPICSRPIKDPVVDHEHKKKVKGSGQVRSNICNMCNTFISRTENNCKRHKIDQESLPEVLKNISNYFSSQQFPIIHYSDKDKRPRLSKIDANKVLKYWILLYPKKKLPKIPKSGILTKDWELYLIDLNKYLASPYETFPKRLWSQLKSVCPSIPEYPKIHKVITPEWRSLLNQYNIK